MTSQDQDDPEVAPKEAPKTLQGVAEEVNNAMDKDEIHSAGSANSDDDEKEKKKKRKSNRFKHHFKRAFRTQREIADQMGFIRDTFGDSYRVEGKKILLHGYLHIRIIRAKGVRNADLVKAFVFNPLMCNCKLNEASDCYVTVHAGSHRLLKTKVIDDDLNPVWNQDFFVPVSHYIEELEFKVKDWDEFGSDDLGDFNLSVHELTAFATDEDDHIDKLCGESVESRLSGASKKSNSPKKDKEKHRAVSQRLLRKGVHKNIYLDGRPTHGSFEFFVDFIPKDLLHTPPRDLGVITQKSPISMVVPGVYFPLRENNRVRLYMNADDKGTAPKVTYPFGDSGEERTWKPQRFFRDIYDSWCQAKKMIYVVGWSVDYTISLLRGREAHAGLNMDSDGNPYSPKIGELLNQKAEEGVIVNMLVWDDNTSNMLKTEGAVATRDEQLRNYFRNSKVNLRLVPMAAGDANLFKKFRQSVYYTHHQKCVICDTPQDELVAYVGGIDLTYGRYDDGTYPLFRTLQSDHKEDFHQACFDVTHAAGPREPWHDIHSRVKGPGTLDLLQNFEERWLGQGGQADELVNIEELGISTSPSEPVEEDEEDNWHTQLFRSIDARTARLKEPEVKATSFLDTKGVEFESEKNVKSGKKNAVMQSVLGSGPEREQHFIGNEEASMDNVTVSQAIEYKRDLKIDCSVQKGLIHHIRNAQHCIYIESQYFLSSSFLWDEDKSSMCCNQIASEITLKICEKIEANERFAAYIVIPMWPEGISESSSVQDILQYQALSMRSMYRRIQKAIDRQRNKLRSQIPEKVKDLMDVKPRDYLNFYCLANREDASGGEETDHSGLLNRTRRHLVYTHSKMTIVDDAIIVCGSANINQRSMDGNRDSELLMGSWQPEHLATRDSVAHGDVHGFRLHCWAHLTGTMDDVYRHPSSLECVRRVNMIAYQNWQLYSQEKVAEMTSYLTAYPIRVTEDGDIIPATKNGKFPDTDANILGVSNPQLPKFLTT